MANFTKPAVVSSKLFDSLTSGKFSEFCQHSSKEDNSLCPFLPFLLRATLLPTVLPDSDKHLLHARILTCDKANFLVSCLSCDFVAMETDLRKEVKIKRKHLSVGSKIDGQSTPGLSVRFENGLVEEKFRILFTELTTADLLLSENKLSNALRKFEPLDNSLLFDDCCHLLSIGLAEMKTLLEFENLCEILLRYKWAPYVIQRLAANFPDESSEMFFKILHNGESVEEDNFVNKKRAETVELLCSMNPSFVSQLISFCLINRRMPCSLIKIGLKFYSFNEFVSILCGIFCATDTQQRIWFTQFVHNAQRSRPESVAFNELANLKEVLRLELCRFARNDVQLSQNVQHCLTILKLLCSLRCSTGLRFTDEETKLIFDFVCTIPDPSCLGSSFIRIALCYVVAFPPSTVPNTDQEVAIVTWLRRLIEIETEFLECGDSFGELLLLITIDFHANQISALSQLISNVLRMKVQLKNNQLVRLKTIFTQDLFSEQVVAERASKIPVTKNLTADCQCYLPVHCIQQLLTSRTFAKHKISIKDWIVSQLLECRSPVHPAVVSLIEAYCTSCIIPLTKSHQHQASVGNVPIDTNTIIAHFEGNVFDKNLLTFRVLLMYYCLLYEELVVNNIRQISSVGRSVQSIDKVFDSIPIYFLFTHVENRLQDFQPVYAPLSKLVTSLFPYLFTSNVVSKRKDNNFAKCQKTPSQEAVLKAMSTFSESPATACKILSASLLTNPDSNLVRKSMDALCQSLPILLNSECSEKLLLPAVRLWNEYEYVFPLRLYLSTISALLPKQHFSKKLLHDDLCNDPLIILRVNEKIFRSPTLLPLLLRILQCYLLASRIKLQKQLLYASASNANRHLPLVVLHPPHVQQQMDAEREELMHALFGAQESAAVQILLETCLKLPNEDESSGVLLEVRNIICSHLHQTFIENTMLAKLVHFQGYPKQIIPIAVSGIPSLHVCLDYVPEILSQPDHTKRIFAIELLSYLCEKYSIGKAYNCAKLAVNVLSTLVSVLPGNEIVKIFDCLVEALVKLCRNFPPLSNDIVSLMVQVGRIAAARLGSKFLAGSSTMDHTPFSWTSPKIPKTSFGANVLDRRKSIEQRLLQKLENAFAYDIRDSVLSCKM